MQQVLKLLAMTAFAALTSLALTACGDSSTNNAANANGANSYGEATLDTSSDQAMKDSLDTMSSGMSDAEKQELGQAFGIVLLVRGMQIQSEGGSQAEMERKLMDELHGLTAEQLLAKAERLQSEMQQ